MDRSPSLASADAAGSAVQRSAPAGRLSLAVGLFVLSGATGLVDQLCFSKYLSYIVGSTAHAVSAVLAAFMTGLAIGAHLGGRWSASVKRPLVAYGVLELVVAAAVALSPLAFAALTPLYVSLARGAPESAAALTATRWLIALLVVVLPTTAMGATLPLLARALPTALPAREKTLGALYAANTLGGALGALLCAYMVLPALGLRTTLLASAALSALVGVIAIAAGWKDVAGSRETPSQTPSEQVVMIRSAPAVRELGLMAALALLSGWLVFGTEVVFVHLLALIIGNSAYAFGLILAVFLICLFVGASRAPSLSRKLGDAALAWGLVGAGTALVVTLPLWDELPLLFAGTGAYITSFAGREALRAVATLLILCLPVTLMGFTFPLLLLRAARYRNVGQLVGRLTAINTLGAVLGSLVTGYVLLPWLGSQHTLTLVGLVFAVAGLATAQSVPSLRRRPIGALALGACALGALAPRWDLARLTSGTNVYFDGAMRADAVLTVEEDVHGGVTSVMKSGAVHTLLTNGKFQGNDGWEMNAQRFFAHYPSLFVDRHDRALVIGLGTGTTLGTLAAYPWKRIDVVEISPAIVRAAERFFQGPNRGSLSDPRVAITIADGRNHLLMNDQTYDLIGMELSSIWFAGAASLYSREFYASVAQHLTERGVFQQWVQLHHIRTRDFAVVLHTLRAEFPEVVLFLGGGQGILVASKQPLRASLPRLRALEQRPSIRAVVPEARPLETLLDDVLVTTRGIDAFVARVAREHGVTPDELVSTDDNLYLEYATPRGNVLPWATRELLIEDLTQFRDTSAIASLRAP